MLFKNREEAAIALSNRLDHYRAKNPLILAIPRGAVPMGRIIAERLCGELDVVLVHKIGHPDNPEYAIGAVDEEGRVYSAKKFTDAAFNAHVNAEIARLNAKRKLYTPLRNRIDPTARNVIIVDDGIATGWTIKAAIALLRMQNPKKIVVAFAVGPKENVAAIKELADEVVCLYEAGFFFAVSQYFLDFSQVSDDEVTYALKGM